MCLTSFLMCYRARIKYSSQLGNLWSNWCLYSLFNPISFCHSNRTVCLGKCRTNILSHFLDQDPDLVRANIAHHEENNQDGNSLLGILVSCTMSFLSLCESKYGSVIDWLWRCIACTHIYRQGTLDWFIETTPIRGWHLSWSRGWQHTAKGLCSLTPKAH